ncbi:Cytochrome b5 heme-binding domain-containing protein [Mycena indigotica]|uniref:Cytochrome b5 heme-binding domain-containing protein n=1 Tax=Mycena indigotica TaxID=2126181 RepID=A0A8H6SEW9_9AGAR|nr:Cytochrome b5 heme-binding domain-containing protein [Mycena indigotica]KAF7297510.1 Cytochrome b5 heme-binding domain-containing protein [Mycena indigotica]
MSSTPAPSTSLLESFWAFVGVAKYSLVVIVPLLFLLNRSHIRSSTRERMIRAQAEEAAREGEKGEKKTIMQPARTDLLPPKDERYTLAQLAEFDGKDGRPIYVSIKGTVFDVTRNAAVYGPGQSYAVFAAKDGSRGLGMSSLKEEDAVPDYSVLDEKDLKVLNDWHLFFVKRYNIVGKVTDHPTILAQEAAAAAEAQNTSS